MEIDIQKMVEDYNSILKENYNGNYERFDKNVEDFKKRYGAIEDDFLFEGSKVKTKFLSIEDEPELNLKTSNNSLWARALCNIHGLFKGDI